MRAATRNINFPVVDIFHSRSKELLPLRIKLPLLHQDTRQLSIIIAELQRAKRASEATWVRKIGNPSSRENLVMAPAYERPHVRPYRLGGRGRGVSRSPIRETNECHLSLAVFCLEKSEKHSFLFAMSTNDRRG